MTDAKLENKPAVKVKGLPTKTTLNLVIKEKKELRLSRVIPTVLIVVILAALFGKFAVADRYAALSKAESALSSHKQAVQELYDSCADYDQVLAEYNRYTYKDFDRTIPDRLDVLNLLEREVFPVCTVQRLAISGRSMSMSLTGLSLQQVSDLLAKLEADPLVQSVTVSTTGYDEDYREEGYVPTANMTVTLVDATTLEGR